MNKYLSIITNFGCHYTCPYCVVKCNDLHIPKTTIGGLDMLPKAIAEHHCNIISLSGGGDPLYEYKKHGKWYSRLFDIAGKIPIEMHTSYLPSEVSFYIDSYYRIVYHCHSISDLSKIKRIGNEIVRVVFVVTESFTVQMLMEIATFVSSSEEIDELSFRQMVNSHYEPQHYLEDILRLEHKKLWYYIEQNDYNIYYAENKVAYRYRDICTSL